MTELRASRIELWVEERDGCPAVNPVIGDLLAQLRDGGAQVRARVVEDEIIDPDTAPGADLVLLKSSTALALSLALADEAAGSRFLDTARATAQAHDKGASIARLAAAGLPVPSTWLRAGTAAAGGSDHPAQGPGAAPGPWVAKPVHGTHGLGVAIDDDVERALAGSSYADLTAAWLVDDGCRLIQRRVGDGPDLKVYVAGEHAFAGWKSFGPASFARDAVRPVDLDGPTLELVRGVGEALGLRCYGVDLRLEDGLLMIIDANPLPGYRGFPAAAAALHSEVRRRLAGATG